MLRPDDNAGLADFYDRYWAGADPTALATHSYRDFQADLHAYVGRQLGSLAGLRALEIGPGLGYATLELARRGAEVWAADISATSLASVRERLTQAGRDVRPVQMQSEALAVAPASFDLVYVECVLMHADWRRTVSECVRVLKPGGRAIFIEPLRHHPAVALYRSTVCAFRQTKPSYLSWSDFAEIRRQFARGEEQPFYLLMPLALPLRGTPLARRLAPALRGVDRALLRLLPLRQIAWYLVASYQL
jgi:ubiquinone/menaquinone biosynthesis C-methylase UbiE